ncbi:MAG: Na+/H+ antiporter NhaC family protein [bacterium]
MILSGSRRILLIGSAVLLTGALAGLRPAAAALWPTLLALGVILATRSALSGLLAGALAGAVILEGGDPAGAVVLLARDHFWSGLFSPWKSGAIVFTILLGGFAAVLEAGGGPERLLRQWAGDGGDRRRRVETAAMGLGLVLFFDGLANSMVVGRVARPLADLAGVARVKLAYIADSTASAVACVALISTWIAFQLGMITEAFALAGRQVNPYGVFLASLPYNFYCWFTLVLLAVAVRRGFHPGPMGGHCRRARPQAAAGRDDGSSAREREGGFAAAAVPLAVLLAAFFLGFLVLGSPRPLLPLSREKLVASFGSDAGPLVMMAAAALALATAMVLFPERRDGRLRPAGRAAAVGMRGMLGPVLILLAAWLLGGVMGDLGTADLLARAAGGIPILGLFPTATFLVGAVVSFSTGTSWGTMGLLFPLTVPAAAALGADEHGLVLVVAAVFSGAVFGDHCSPFSDTTIVTSISCGVTPHDHVRTQLPYALLTAATAIVLGFLPAGFGVPAWILLPLGVLALVLLPGMIPPAGLSGRGRIP